MVTYTPSRILGERRTFSRATALVSIIGSLLLVVTARSQGPQGNVTPRSGWLYVAVSDFDLASGGVAIVDPNRGVVSTLVSGVTPDVVVSPDGRRLYIASTHLHEEPITGTIDVIDTQSGVRVAQLDDPDPFMGTGAPYLSRMAVSPGGASLFIIKKHFTEEEGGRWYLEIIDTTTNTILPHTIPLPLCHPNGLLPTGPRQLYVLCSDTQDIWRLDATDDGTPRNANPPRLSVTAGRRVESGLATAFLSGAGAQITAIGEDGQFVTASGSDLSVVRMGAVDRIARQRAATTTPVARSSRTQRTNANDWFAQREAWIQNAFVSRDQSRVFFSMGRLISNGMRDDRIVTLAADSLKRLQVIETSQPFWSLAASSDGRWLYAVDPDKATILVINSATGIQERSLTHVGKNPLFAVVAP